MPPVSSFILIISFLENLQLLFIVNPRRWSPLHFFGSCLGTGTWPLLVKCRGLLCCVSVRGGWEVCVQLLSFALLFGSVLWWEWGPEHECKCLGCEWECQGHSFLCKYASEAMSTLGCRCLTYPRDSSGLPFLPNKPQALVAKRRGGQTWGGAERALQVVNGRCRS